MIFIPSISRWDNVKTLRYISPELYSKTIVIVPYNQFNEYKKVL